MTIEPISLAHILDLCALLPLDPDAPLPGRIFFDPEAMHVAHRVIFDRPVRGGKTIYCCGSERTSDAGTVFRAWAMDADSCNVVPIGNAQYDCGSPALALWARSVMHLWTAQLVATTPSLVMSVRRFHAAVQQGANPHQHRQDATRLAKSCGASIEWDGDRTQLRWVDAEGSTAVENLTAIAAQMQFRLD